MEEDGWLDKKELFHFIFNWDTFRDVFRSTYCIFRGHTLSKSDQKLLITSDEHRLILHCARCDYLIIAERLDDKRYRTWLPEDEDILLD